MGSVSPFQIFWIKVNYKLNDLISILSWARFVAFDGNKDELYRFYARSYEWKFGFENLAACPDAFNRIFPFLSLDNEKKAWE